MSPQNDLRKIIDRPRYVPFVRDLKIRMAIGFILLILSIMLAGMIFGRGRIETAVFIGLFAWLPAVLLTDKYIHKYPQRYFTYLIASHLKAAIIMALLLFIIGRVPGFLVVPRNVLWTGYIFFIFADALVSVPCRRDFYEKQFYPVNSSAVRENYGPVPPSFDIEKDAFIEPTLLNNVNDFDRFFQNLVKQIAIGGYLVVRYIPLENAKKGFKRRLSKAEAWGRLAYYGMWVIRESEGFHERYIIARKVMLQSDNKNPSYYPIITLEKVGLDGKIIHMHKIRTMFPFSEFLQKRLVEEHGLTRTGKIADDFRITGPGKFLRKYWLDELPQIFDWLHGDFKLVGVRATSRSFLSLYPKEFYDLYIQIKPGIISSIFDESTGGFSQIVKTEFAYLQSYRDHPIRTDIRYLIQTFTDIFFRGIRSR